jgi:hypothetical protein
MPKRLPTYCDATRSAIATPEYNDRLSRPIINYMRTIDE